MKSYETKPERSADGSQVEGEPELVDGAPDATEVAEHVPPENNMVMDTPDKEEHELVVMEQHLPDSEQRRPFFSKPSREQVLTGIAFWGVILLGAVLRFWGLGDKPLHHDESLHAYFSLQLLHQMENWSNCFNPAVSCYHYDPLLHGPFQFHFIALVYKLSQIFGAPDNGVNTYTLGL